eukprot:GHUV01018625.1.p1 GENE.GHUV01018625.1~~GHUV01018625.1.p1  ORF type:complete len:897 (+),score=270.26 GHUV01018625.1:870-3560(+)
MMQAKQPMQHPRQDRCRMASRHLKSAAGWTLLLVALLAVHCPGTATAQPKTAADTIPTTTNPAATTSPNLTSGDVQLMPTLPLQTASANQTRGPSSSTASNQQQQPAASPIPSGDRSSTGGDTGGVVPDPESSKTDSAVQQAEQQVQGPVDTTSQPIANAMPLINFPGCTNRGGSPFLPPGVSRCEVQGLLNRREADVFTFNVAPATDSSRPYRVLIMLRTVDGDAQLGLSVPQNNVTDPIPDQVGTQIYGTEITTEVIIEVPWGILSQNPGTYIISISQAHRRVLYTLQVMTPFDDVVLAEPDLSAIKDLHKACCDDSNATSSFCTEYLPAAIAPQHSADDDLCRMTPMMCDENGHLIQLAIAQAGLICQTGLPASFGQLEFLETIDLAFNDLNMAITDMGKIIAQLPALQNAFLRYTGLSGPLSDDCDLIKSKNLTRLSISGNNITGSLPDCYLKDETLEELYLSQTGLRGPLPDVVPPGSPLRLLYAINYIQPDRVGFTGPLPASLFSSASLTYLDLANHKFSGGIPAMNNNMRLLNLSMNTLDGQIEGTFPASLETLDLAFNQLQGSLPAGIDQLANLTLFNVESNRLGGSLPQALPDGLLVFDVSNNQFTGSPPSTLPAALHFFNAGHNQLTGSLPAVSNPSLLVTYQLYDNNLSGTLPLSLVNGSAPALMFVDLHGNQLSGRLDGSSGSSSTGRKMLQDGSTGAVWGTMGLGYLDLSNNSFTGPIPASLGNLTDLVIMDVSNNQLSGSLEPFADLLTTSASDVERPDLLWLNVSNNQLSGSIPNSLQYAPMMDPSRVGTMSRRGQLPPRILDLSNNSFSGPFPTWLPTQSALVARACGQLCRVDVDVNGTDMKLSCPADLAVTPDQIPFLKRQNFQCTDNSGQQVGRVIA